MGFMPSELAEKLTSPRPPLTPKQALLVTGRMKKLKLTELCRRGLFLSVVIIFVELIIIQHSSPAVILDVTLVSNIRNFSYLTG